MKWMVSFIGEILEIWPEYKPYFRLEFDNFLVYICETQGETYIT